MKGSASKEGTVSSAPTPVSFVTTSCVMTKPVSACCTAMESGRPIGSKTMEATTTQLRKPATRPEYVPAAMSVTRLAGAAGLACARSAVRFVASSLPDAFRVGWPLRGGLSDGCGGLCA